MPDRPAPRTHLYDEIGHDYHLRRRPDPRIAAAILDALGPAGSVLNVGAGTGSYEPSDRRVVAVEPSLTMIRQRDPGGAQVVRATATALPFADDAFAASLAILTVHHWPDPARGLAEMTRVARDRAVVLSHDPAPPTFWLTDVYFPEIIAADRLCFPELGAIERGLGRFSHIERRPVPIPHDCVDGFLGAYWRRPEAYLDTAIRSSMSAFSRIPDSGPGLARLRRDLDDGTWERRHGALRGLQELDLGYRILIARRDA